MRAQGVPGQSLGPLGDPTETKRPSTSATAKNLPGHPEFQPVSPGSELAPFPLSGGPSLVQNVPVFLSTLDMNSILPVGI